MTKSNSPGNELNEGITQLIEQASAKFEDPALEGFPFQVLFATNEKNQVKVTVRWPDDAPAQAVQILSNMLHHISEGHWKTPMINAVHQQGQVKENPALAISVLKQWSHQTQVMVHAQENRHVKPSQVFQRGGR